jgi:hypothetical protein
MPFHTEAERRKNQRKKKKPVARLAILHQGESFESQGLGKFAKDVVRIGKWIHPATGQDIQFDSERLKKLAESTSKYLFNGNKIPFPDGHSIKTKDNMGFWPGPFIVHKDSLVGVVEPTDEDAKKGLMDGSLDSVSAFIDFNVEDPKGNVYDEVITHVCATNYPVVTEQKEFIALAQKCNTEVGVDLYLHESVEVAKEEEDGDEVAQEALDRFADAVTEAESLQVLGGTFEACVSEIMLKQGVSRESAQATCASIKRKAGELSQDERIAAALLDCAKGGNGD